MKDVVTNAASPLKGSGAERFCRHAGKTLRQLDLTNRYKIQVIAVRPGAGGKQSFIPSPDKALSAGDTIVVIGHRGQLESFKL